MRLFIFAILLHIAVGEKTFEYYKNLWNDNVQQLRQYRAPTENSEFKNYDPNCTVGAGSAGAVLANRLSEIGSLKILLLEAGGDETDFTKIPAAFPGMMNSDVNWGYYTTSQAHACLGMIDRKCSFARGKILGGCSATNALMFVRGNRRDFDSWEALGNKGWGYRHVLRYFKKSENATGVNGDPKYRGLNGPSVISHAKPPSPIMDSIIAANEELNYTNLDYNGAKQLGIAEMQLNTNFGRRDSTNQAYLQPILYERPNLDLITKALVTKILFKKNRAIGVKFVRNGKCHIARIRKELIVSAGTVNSAQLLMLSGIGPKDHLAEFNIPLVADLPVGQNLEDHPNLLNVPISTNMSLDFDFDTELKKYLNGEGRLTHTVATQLGFTKVTTDKYKDVPDVEVMYIVEPSSLNTSDLAQRFFNHDANMNSFFAGMKPNTIFLYFMLLHPKSRGEIRLKSADPIDFPIINPNYLEHPDDIERIFLGVVKTLELLKTRAFKAIDAKLGTINIDACNSLPPLSREFWYCFIRHMTQGLYHPIGTCRMGTDPRDSVVDNKLRVHGIKKLRVIDVSVVPKSTSGHMNAVAIMIGEKMSHEIKKRYSC